MYEICSLLTINAPEGRLTSVLLSLLLTLKIFHTLFGVSIDFVQGIYHLDL